MSEGKGFLDGLFGGFKSSEEGETASSVTPESTNESSEKNPVAQEARLAQMEEESVDEVGKEKKTDEAPKDDGKDDLVKEIERELKEYEEGERGEDEEEEEITKEDLKVSDKKPESDDSKDEEAAKNNEPPKDGEKIPEFGEGLLKRASEFGLSESQAKALGTPAELDSFLDKLEIQMVRLASGKKPDESVGKEEPKPEQKGDEKSDETEFKIELDPEVYDEELVETFEKMRKHYDGVVKKLEKRLEVFESEVEARHQEQFFDSFDQAITSLGETGEKLFGKGTRKDLERGSSAWENRGALLDEMRVLGMGYESAGREVPDMEKLMRLAMVSRFGDKIGGAINKELESALEKRSNMIVGKPSKGRGGSSGSGRDAAVDEVASQLREYGVD